MDDISLTSRPALAIVEENSPSDRSSSRSAQISKFHNFGGSMTAQIGTLVRWGKSSPTRLGYKASDIGKVIGVHNGRSGSDELDVEFPDGDVIRGAFEEWFESVQLGTEEAVAETRCS